MDSRQAALCYVILHGVGEVPEWLKGPAWKACVRETVPRVRIPLSPKKYPRTRQSHCCPVVLDLIQDPESPQHRTATT